MVISISEIRASSVPMNFECPHTQHRPVFNAEACQYKSKEQIQKDYPRYQGKCSACSQEVILYASVEHFVSGGWADKGK